MTRRILILDDDPNVTRTVALVLSSFGYEPYECHCPQEALTRLLEEPFEAVLTDFQMPFMSGLELIQELRKRECTISAIMMSGDVASIDIALAQQLGVLALLSKPFGRDELKNAMESIAAPHAHFLKYGSLQQLVAAE